MKCRVHVMGILGQAAEDQDAHDNAERRAEEAMGNAKEASGTAVTAAEGPASESCVLRAAHVSQAQALLSQLLQMLPLQMQRRARG